MVRFLDGCVLVMIRGKCWSTDSLALKLDDAELDGFAGRLNAVDGAKFQ